MRPVRASTTIAAFAAFVLIAGGLLAGWHRASVMHGVCAEHGDELHLVQVADHDCEAEGDDDSRIAASTWVAFDADHHCQVASASREALTPTATTRIVVAVPPVTTLAIAAAPAAAPGVALLHLAPKTSPPRA